MPHTLAFALDHVQDVVLILNSDGRIYYGNAAAAKILGAESRGALVGRLLFELLPLDSFPEPTLLLHAIRTGTNYETDCQLHELDVRASWYRLSVSGMPDDGCGRHVLLVCRDATEEHKTQELLALKQGILRNVRDAIFLVELTKNGPRIVYVNPALLHETGFTHDEIIGRSSDFWYGPETDPAVIARLAEAEAAEAPIRVEAILHRVDGTKFWAELDVASLPPTAKGIRRRVTVQRNIDDRKRLEEKYRRSQRMEALGHLAGGVSHDFNNILTVITGCADLMLMTLPADHDGRSLVEEIRKASDRAAGFTRQLLAFSRRHIVCWEVVDLNAVLREMTPMLNRLLGEGITLDSRFRTDAAPVKADRGNLEQILLNLVVNARDAMPRGGRLVLEMAVVDVTLEEARGYINVAPGPHARLSVIDTGIGMAPEVQSRVFEPFFTTKDIGKGTGQGLATVQSVVLQLAGFVTLDSKVGRGTRFDVFIPLTTDALDRPRPVAVPRMTAGQETILVVEDDDSVRALTTMVLQQDGYTVLTAGNGSEALEMCDSHPGTIHLVLTDVVMPGMNGKELIDHLREWHPELRTVFLSGYTDDEVLRHGIEQEHVAFIQKPYTPTQLKQRVREILDQAR